MVVRGDYETCGGRAWFVRGYYETVRSAWLLVAVVACGRIDFDPLTGAPFDSAALDPDLVAWWPFDRTLAEDATGHGHDAVCVSPTCPVLVPGRLGQAIQLDGTQSLQVVSTPDLRTQAGFSIATWLWVDAAPTGTRNHVVTKALGTTNGDSWAISLEGDLTIHIWADTLAAGSGVAGITPLAVSRWHHLAFTWDGSRGTAFVDAQVDAAASFPMLDWDDNPVSIGSDFENSAACCYMTGLVDDVRVYRRALTSDEVAALAAP